MSKYFTNDPLSTRIFNAEDVVIAVDNLEQFYLLQTLR